VLHHNVRQVRQLLTGLGLRSLVVQPPSATASDHVGPRHLLIEAAVRGVGVAEVDHLFHVGLQSGHIDPLLDTDSYEW
jgi:hypothetical protein